MKRKWLKGLTPLAATAAFVVSSTQVWATSLPIGGNVVPSIVSGTGVSSGVTILADTGWLSSATVDGSGQVREIVVSGDKNNSLSGLDFIYQVKNTSSNSYNLSGMDAFQYGSFQTNVLAANPGSSSFTSGSNSFATPGPTGNDPTSATRSDDLGNGTVGNQVSFNFGSNASGTLTPGSYSDLMIVQTDATNYQPGIIDFNAGGTSDHLAGFEPASATPEPSSVVLLSVCLAALGAVGAFQRRKEVVPVLS
jgi:hypothetical protein